MQIQLSEAAVDYLQSRLHQCSNEAAFIKLVYDSEGCGCAISGIPQLWVVSSDQLEDCVHTTNQSFPIYYETQHEVFFEPQLKLQFTLNNKCFRLSSDQQIYNTCMVLQDKR